MSRLPDPTALPGAAGREAEALRRQIVGGPGHDYPGLYQALLADPELGRRVSQLASWLQFHNPLPPKLRELAVLAVAARLRSPYLWTTHQSAADHAGLPEELREALQAGDPLHWLEGDVVAVVDALLEHRVVDQALQDRVVAATSVAAFAHLAVMVDFHRMVADLARGLEFPLPEGASDPWA